MLFERANFECKNGKLPVNITQALAFHKIILKFDYQNYITLSSHFFPTLLTHSTTIFSISSLLLILHTTHFSSFLPFIYIPKSSQQKHILKEQSKADIDIAYRYFHSLPFGNCKGRENTSPSKKQYFNA